MGTMTAKEYLSQYRSIAAEVIQRRIIVRRMKRDIFGGPTDRVTSAMEAAGGRTAAANIWSASDLAEYQKQIEEQEAAISSMRRYMATVIGQISRLDNADQRTVLFARYITLLTWDEIGAAVNYDSDYVRKMIHQSALQAFTRKFSDEFYKVMPENAKIPTS